MQPNPAPPNVDEIESALRTHPFVGSVSVSRESAPNGAGYSVAYVVPSDDWLQTTAAETPAPELERRVGTWQRIFDGTYRRPSEIAPDFVGWTSSFTNRPLPEDEMREWLDATIARIADLAPRRVLEIGCGIGLLVEALAPRCEAYCGTDFSATAIDRLREFCAPRPPLRHVRLLQREATDFSGLAPGSVDTVVINSVIQYFPHLDYLRLVLERAAATVAPGGHIFIGDVRHLGLLAAFHASVQLAKADPNSTVRSLRRRIGLAIEQEQELVIDPQFFVGLARSLPRIAGGEIMAKRGDADNELTRYRYDVVLHVGDPGAAASPPCRVEDLDPTRDDLAILQLLESALDDELVKDLRDRLTEFDPTGPRPGAAQSPIDRPLATDPVAVALRNALAVTLGQFLRSRLPASPLPAAVVVLSRDTALSLA